MSVFVIYYIFIINKTFIMSRNKVSPEKQKQTVSVRIPNDLMIHLEDVKNKSKFFEWLLEEYFNSLNKND